MRDRSRRHGENRTKNSGGSTLRLMDHRGREVVAQAEPTKVSLRQDRQRSRRNELCSWLQVIVVKGAPCGTLDSSSVASQPSKVVVRAAVMQREKRGCHEPL